MKKLPAKSAKKPHFRIFSPEEVVDVTEELASRGRSMECENRKVLTTHIDNIQADLFAVKSLPPNAVLTYHSP